MTIRPLLLLSALSALMLVGCYADELDRELELDPFFDLANYIDRQVDSLEILSPSVEKTIVLNGEEESKQLSDLNFKNDLRTFRDADINKPAWLDKYTVERQEDGNVLTHTYTAQDSSLQTRRLTVTSEGGKITRIEVFRLTGTVLSHGEHRLYYDPTSGYGIRTEQTNRLGEDLNANITVRWAQKKR